MIEANGDEQRGSRWQWVAGAGAVVLALAIVAGLVLIRGHGSAQPAAAGHPIGTVTMATQLDFHCALPVQGYSTQARVTFPDGGVAADHVLQPARGTTATPGSSYADGTWLPVPIAWVSPDGGSYAYVASTTGVPGQAQSSAVFVHDVARKADRQLWSGSGYAQMIGWASGGVYFARQGTPGAVALGPSTELWAVDPGNPGGAHRVGPNAGQQAAGPGPLFQAGTRIAGGAAWTVSYGVTHTPTAPGAAAAVILPSRVVRMDLKDGSLSTWYEATASTSLSIAAIDQQGHPVVVVNAAPRALPQGLALATAPRTSIGPAAPRVILLTGPNQAVEIADGSDPTFRPSNAIADGHGVWFAAPGSLWLYRHGALAKVADVPAGLFPLPPLPSNVAVPPPPPNLATPVPSIAQPQQPPPPPDIPTGVILTLAGPCR